MIKGVTDPTGSTVSFQVVDGDGKTVSFVNSNYISFGTGIVLNGYGFTLHNGAAGVV